jgi:hypothetical protein
LNPRPIQICGIGASALLESSIRGFKYDLVNLVQLSGAFQRLGSAGRPTTLKVFIQFAEKWREDAGAAAAPAPDDGVQALYAVEGRDRAPRFTALKGRN